jgi:hypothetical protein
MTKIFSILFCCWALVFSPCITAQNTAINPRSRAAVLHIDTKGLVLDPVQMGNLVRLELDKTNQYEVLDKYDVEYLAEREQLQFDKCFGKICLVETGRKLRADKMLTGSVELLGERIIVSLRLIDVGTESVEKNQVMEFLNLRNSIQQMIEITLRQMLNLSNDPNLVKTLTQADNYANALNVPEVSKLNLSGPRMGITIFSGETATRFRQPRSEGGLDVAPVMFQFGYQFETAYLNQGNLQALFEFFPVITGLDQSQIIPSLTVLHGVRSNRNGLEFAFGPSVVLSREAQGFYDGENNWNLLSEWRQNNSGTPPYETIYRFDSRGESVLKSSFVFAFGKSFKSGRMNIPVNLFFIPNKAGARYGISVGFNGRG